VVVQGAQTTLPTYVAPAGAAYPSVNNQEWDIFTVGNCGDIPANCTNPPLTTLGDYYVIVNKGNGLVLGLNGSTIDQETPAAASNGDWIVPSAKGQLWQIVPVHISAPSTPTLLTFAAGTPASITAGGNLGTISVDVENTAEALIETPSEPVTLTVTGPGSFSYTTPSVASSSAVSSFNLSGVPLDTAGSYTLTATSGSLTEAVGAVTVNPATLTITCPNGSFTQGGPVPYFPATVSGVILPPPASVAGKTAHPATVHPEKPTGLIATCGLAPGITADSAPNYYPGGIVPNLSGLPSSNYIVNPVDGNLTINGAEPVRLPVRK